MSLTYCKKCEFGYSKENFVYLGKELIKKKYDECNEEEKERLNAFVDKNGYSYVCFECIEDIKLGSDRELTEKTETFYCVGCKKNYVHLSEKHGKHEYARREELEEEVQKEIQKRYGKGRICYFCVSQIESKLEK